MAQDHQLAAPNVVGPDLNTRQPILKMPVGSCDCHAHVFGPQSKYPYAPQRSFTPADAAVTEYLNMLDAIGADRGVLVQPSPYAMDNSALLAALAVGESRLRGIVSLDESVTDTELQRMHDAGVRGVRLNWRSAESPLHELAPRMAARIAGLGWHLEICIKTEDLNKIERILPTLPVDIVLDHMGQVPLRAGLNGESLQIILAMVKSGRCWVKLSAPMRLSSQKFPHTDVKSLVAALVGAGPYRMVWGTDWPHPHIKTRMPNDADLVDLLTDWIPDEMTRHQILVNNPARLYCF